MCLPPAGRSTGFTLVELMVVLFVMALIGTAVVLTAEAGRSRAEIVAGALCGLIEETRDAALVGGLSRAVVITEAGPEVRVLRAGAWQADPEARVARTLSTAWRDVQLDAPEPLPLWWALDPTGASEGGSLTLSDARTAVTVSLSPTGEVGCARTTEGATQ